jgi:hypothetical protein
VRVRVWGAVAPRSAAVALRPIAHAQQARSLQGVVVEAWLRRARLPAKVRACLDRTSLYVRRSDPNSAKQQSRAAQQKCERVVVKAVVTKLHEGAPRGPRRYDESWAQSCAGAAFPLFEMHLPSRLSVRAFLSEP